MARPKKYNVDSRSYLKRARIQLDSRSYEGLFYAAFELRCGIEERMQEYLEGHNHIPKSIKKEWRLGNLDKAILKYFGDSNRITQVTVRQIEKPHEEFTAYYTPVTPELIKIGQKLGNLLHAQKKFISPDASFWNKTRNLLERAYMLLEISNKGTLMGPPIWDKNTKRAKFIAMPNCDHELDKYKQIVKKGEQIELEIKHLKEFPES